MDKHLKQAVALCVRPPVLTGKTEDKGEIHTCHLATVPLVYGIKILHCLYVTKVMVVLQ